MFAAIYWLCLCVLFVFLSPFLCVCACFCEKYRESIPSRFFLRGYKKRKKFDSEVWIHACSLGEVSALEEIIKHIKGKITLSTITNTGFTRANELFGDNPNIQICYLPFEIFLPFVMPKIKKLIVLEAELWYLLFFSAKKRGAKTILLNARISSKSYPKYKKNAWFYRILFDKIDIVLCQQDQDKERLTSLGAKKIEVIGNIKALNTPKVSKILDKFDGILIVGASTHEGEEELIITNFIRAFKEKEDSKTCLVIAPRHPHRFELVWNLIAKYPLKSAKYSQNGLDYNCDIILLDTIGELINIYNVADLVILGGSFVKVGGHNPLEAAHFHTRILSGVHIFNQHALFAMVSGYKIIKNDELFKNLVQFWKLPKSEILVSNVESIIKYIE